MRHILAALAVGLGLVLLAPAAAQAHVERPSYWPDPKPDCTVHPCAGGKVPTIRSLASALDDRLPGRTRVVCQRDSLIRLRASVRTARQRGYDIRPTDHRRLSASWAHRLLRINSRLLQRCRYHQIQTAVTASGNNDRVVVMPGLYREPTARAQPTHDPACNRYRITSDSGDPGALSHDYQLHCPNDANLIAVIGRGADTGPVPSPPRTERHGIPNVGRCIRCNVQLEGSGVSADDVVVEAGDARAGDGGPSAAGHKKDVGIFVDRADGFVLRNLTVRHAREHDIYILETDGYVFDRFKAFYAGGYGVLTFVEDHGLVQNCDAAGNGDSGLYPGSGADTTDHRYRPFYPHYRYSQVFRRCDSHHNTGGFSGTDSHGTLVTQNNFYDNALGYTTDVFTAPGHPGFPQHGNVVADNNFYANNFNPYTASSDVSPFIAAPVGTGLWLAGGNANTVRGNHFYDNWRRGAMLFAVPDATVCGPAPVGSSTPIPGCDPAKVSTSYDNQFHDNVMGIGPDGRSRPNGVDFWWDAFPGTTGNCWWHNTGPGGSPATTSPLLLPSCANGTNRTLSVGTGDAVNEGELVGCLAGFQVSGYPAGDSTTCSWATTPERPGTGPVPLASVLAPALLSRQQQAFTGTCESGLSPRLCAAYGMQRTSADAATPLPRSARRVAHTRGVVDDRPLSRYTCSWWRRADAAHRHGAVQRIRHFATGRVESPYGYGAGMSDARAVALFDDRCSMFQAGPFALYKIYGAAAPFAALTP